MTYSKLHKIEQLKENNFNLNSTFGVQLGESKPDSMRRLFTVLIFIISACQFLYCQTSIQGKPMGEIFTDFHYISGDTSKTTGFGINRAHLGYNYTPEGDFSATIMINIGTPGDMLRGTLPKRYAYFREASVAYTKDKLTINFGMVNTRIFDFQQRFWGKRYLGTEFQALYEYGTVADLGVVVDYRISDLLKFDISILNGEGYTNIQVDNSLRTAAGILITPGSVAIRLYGDVMKKSGVLQTTLITFAGWKTDLFSIGGEFSYKTNIDPVNGLDTWGLSATGSVFINNKNELFARMDYIGSVPGTVINNDLNKYTTYFIGGIQHNFTQNLKISLNYRRTNPILAEKKPHNALFINAAFKF